MGPFFSKGRKTWAPRRQATTQRQFCSTNLRSMVDRTKGAKQSPLHNSWGSPCMKPTRIVTTLELVAPVGGKIFGGWPIFDSKGFTMAPSLETVATSTARKIPRRLQKNPRHRGRPKGCYGIAAGIESFEGHRPKGRGG